MLTATRQSRRNGNGIALNDIGHQGLMHDEELQVAGGSLIYNRARTLHPGMRRFVQRDPWMADADGLIPTAGDGYPFGVVLYEYLRSNPMGNVDPTGEVPALLIFTIGRGASKLGIASYCYYQCSKCLGDNAKIDQGMVAAIGHDHIKLKKYLDGLRKNPPCADICKQAGVEGFEAVVWLTTSGGVAIMKMKIRFINNQTFRRLRDDWQSFPRHASTEVG